MTWSRVAWHTEPALGSTNTVHFRGRETAAVGVTVHFP
jgi:hypothetical protein